MAIQPGETGAAPHPAGPASRKLDGLEHAMRITDDVTPFNVVSVLRLEGVLPAPALRTALDVLQRRHPLLRARILEAGSDYVFHFDVTAPIPLAVSARPDDGDWVATAEEELHLPLDVTVGPLARCRYLVGPTGGDLIFTIHHTIVDAVSALPLFAELLGLCAHPSSNEEDRATEEGQIVASALFPDEYTGLGYARAVAGYMGRQMADEMEFRWRSMGVRKAPIAAHGRCHVLPIRFDARLTTALIQASRRERVTLTAILSAGMVSAVQRTLYPSPRVPLRHILFADLRARLRHPVPETVLGCFLTMFRLTVLVERDGAFWALARQIQDATVRAARAGERYMAYALSPGTMKMLFRLKAFRMGATALSYTGPLNLPANYGTFEVTGVHAFAANMTLGPEYSALVRLFRDELWWDLLYLDSDMDAAGAERIAQLMRTILEEATC